MGKRRTKKGNSNNHKINDDKRPVLDESEKLDQVADEKVSDNESNDTESDHEETAKNQAKGTLEER